jgi:hypothetical protein
MITSLAGPAGILWREGIVPNKSNKEAGFIGIFNDSMFPKEVRGNKIPHDSKKNAKKVKTPVLRTKSRAVPTLFMWFKFS